jgi:mannose-6-phosphate isomerase
MEPGASAAALRRYLIDGLLPFWAEHGPDRRHGGFHNRLLPDGSPSPDDHKRIVAQARQLYAFSHARLLGAGDWALELATQGFAYLWDRGWDRRHGGWYFTLTPAGEPLDRRKDTYAHAFALFALAYYHRASGESAPLELAEHTLDLLDKHLADRLEGGYFDVASEDWSPDLRLRRQNPHMHLLEAFLALAETTGETRYVSAAHRLVALLRERLFDPETRTLGEYFDSDWTLRPGAEGAVVEPGHHFEWVWLLHRYGALCAGGEVPEEASALFDFAIERGLDRQRGGVLDELDRSGAVVRATQRVWPQTELLQALAARWESQGSAATLALLESHLARCFRERVPDPGRAWREQLGPDGRVVSDTTPSTTVYHIVLALAEVARALEARPPR